MKLALAAVQFVATLASAATVLNGTADFTTPTTLLDFETFPDRQAVPYTSADLSAQWGGYGVFISDSSTANGASAYSATYNVRSHSGTRGIADSEGNERGGYVNFSFAAPVLEAGLWVQNADNASIVSFFDVNGSLLHSVSASGVDAFAGLRAVEGIASIRVTDFDYYLVDDLQFSAVPVPEPSHFALLGCGLAGLIAVGRRRR